MPMILAYHLVFCAYGFWLPNDPRGSGSNYVGSRAIYAFGPATFVRTCRSLARDPHDHAARLAAKQALQRPPVRFTGIQAREVGRAIGAFVERSDIVVRACAVLPEHVHVVVERPHYKAEQLINLLKGATTRALCSVGIHPFQHLVRASGSVPKMWARSGWVVYLDSPAAIRRAVKYVEDNPLKEGKRAQRWSFVSK